MFKQALIIFILTVSFFSFSDAQNEYNCTKDGFSCSDCWTSLFCIDLGDGNFAGQETPCPTGTICRKSTGECKAGGYYECEVPDAEFKCYSAGIFPDPYSCDKYHICSENEVERGGEDKTASALSDIMNVDYGDETKTCNPLYSFDSYTGRCSKRLEPWMPCSSIVPVCNVTGQMGPLANPHYFYRCTLDSEKEHLLPEIFACPNNFLFNVTSCVDPSPVVADKDGNCARVGRFYNPTDCNKYRTCNTIGTKPVDTTCPLNNRFDPIKSICVPFTCSNYLT